MHGGGRFFRAVRNHQNAEPDGRESEAEKSAAGSQAEINWHKIIWEEYFPVAFSIGISIEEFKHLNPTKLGYCLKGYAIQERRKDAQMWAWLGNYGLSAVSTAIEHNFSKHPKSKYIEKPMLQDEKENTSGNSESREECAVYEMKQRINLLRQQGLPESPD